MIYLLSCIPTLPSLSLSLPSPPPPPSFSLISHLHFSTFLIFDFSLSSAICMTRAALAGKMMMLPRLAFAATMTAALEIQDPINVTSRHMGVAFNEAMTHPDTLSWGAAALMVLLGGVLFHAGMPTPTDRSRLPFADIKAIQCQWSLGCVLSLLSAYMWILYAIDTLPSGCTFMSALVAQVAGVWACVSTAMMLQSTERSPLLVTFINAFGGGACVLLVVMVASSGSTLWTIHNENDNGSGGDDGQPDWLLQTLLQAAAPLTLACVALLVAIAGCWTTAAAVRLNRARSMVQQWQGGVVRRVRGDPHGPRRRSGASPRERRHLYPPATRVGPSPINLAQMAEGCPPLYDDAATDAVGPLDRSSEIMEAAEMIASEGQPPSYQEAVSDSDHVPFTVGSIN
eukprot:m.71933 g.71933  ORF g.71933 m.71933 type:complete len:399 (+) comp8751_c2_seq1:159-1355(+)